MLFSRNQIARFQLRCGPGKCHWETGTSNPGTKKFDAVDNRQKKIGQREAARSVQTSQHLYAFYVQRTILHLAGDGNMVAFMSG